MKYLKRWDHNISIITNKRQVLIDYWDGKNICMKMED